MLDSIGKFVGIVFRVVVGILVIDALILGVIWLYGQVTNPVAVVTDNKSGDVVVNESPVSTSCVKRMEPGDSAEVFTETWDSETRVWVLEDGTCEGPYCFSYDSCDNPEVTITRQPFWTGHELSPVNGKPFVICNNFEGECAR